MVISGSSFCQSWLQRFILNEERRLVLREMFDLIYKETVIQIRKDFKTIVPIVEFNSITGICYLLEGLLNEEAFPNMHTEKVVKFEGDERKQVPVPTAVGCCAWGLGSAMAF